MSELFVKQECEDINIYHTTANMNKLQIKEEGNIELSEIYHYHNDNQNLNDEDVELHFKEELELKPDEPIQSPSHELARYFLLGSKDLSWPLTRATYCHL